MRCPWAIAFLSLLVLPGCSVGYVLRSAWHQAELLHSREPIEKVRKSGRLTKQQLAALDVIEDVKKYGGTLGLRATKNYDSVALRYPRRIWNVTACAPLSFREKTWCFPIVGRVPYLGYFSEAEARRKGEELSRQGLDVYVQEVGAYSTLGWFKDPILPSMLEWGEFALADTILHELTHATVWVKGGVAFNESFASFVGEEGAFRYLEARHGRDSEAVRRAHASFEDGARWSELQHRLFLDLEKVYGDAALSPEAKAARKAALFAELPGRATAAGFHEPARFVRAAREGVWNNARLALFRTYHSDRPAFETLLARRNGDLLRFIEDIRQIASRGEPFAELRKAAQS
jgi:predicted aminopeptidase